MSDYQSAENNTGAMALAAPATVRWPCTPTRELADAFAANDGRLPGLGLAIAVTCSVGLWAAMWELVR